MPSGDRIKVRGADEVARTLHALADDLEDLPDVDAAGLVQRSAQGFARRRTGRMRASIEVKDTSAGATVTAGVGIARPYPAVQEYGSRRHHITPNAFMRRAVESQERPVVAVYENAVQKAAKQVRGV